jgi:hypothetical protein
MVVVLKKNSTGRHRPGFRNMSRFDPVFADHLSFGVLWRAAPEAQSPCRLLPARAELLPRE